MKTLPYNPLKITSILLLIFFHPFFPQLTDEPVQVEDLDKKNPSDHLMDAFTDPQTHTETNDAKNAFTNAYYDANPNLIRTDVVVALTSQLETLLQKYANTNDSGLVFHYALSANLDSIQYIISLGSQDSDGNISPFPKDAANPQDYYILLDGGQQGGSTKFIDQSDFCTRTKRYKDNLKMKIDNAVDSIKNIPNHPLMVYHQGTELDLFFTERPTPRPTHLYLIHGASNRIASDTRFHVPYLVWGNSSSPLAIDDTAYQKRYQKKALDLGHLCPPYCRDQPKPSKMCE